MIRAQLVEHPEHGILRLRDDYYARQRALIGGVILAGALILGQILAQRIGENVFAQLTQMVVSAVAARPRAIKGLPEGPLTDALVEAFAQRAFDSIRPLTSLNGDPEWRRQMIKILVRRAFEQATQRPQSAPECV